MASRIFNKWQGYTIEDLDCKYCLHYGGKSKGRVKCRAGKCICMEEREEALRRDQAKHFPKFIFIYFLENMRPGSPHPRKDEIAIMLEPMFQKLSFFDMRSENPDSIFHCWKHDRFGELLQLFRDWERSGISATIIHRFVRPIEWIDWKKDLFIGDEDVHWKVLIEYDNGTCADYVELGYLFPKELRRIYALAESMNPKK